MPFDAYLTPSSYIVYKMAEGLSLRSPDLGKFCPIFHKLKPIFHIQGPQANCWGPWFGLEGPQKNLCTLVLMAFDAYLTPSSYIVFKMAEGLSLGSPDLGKFCPIFHKIKANFPYPGTLS